MICPICHEDREKFIGGKCQRCYHKAWEEKAKRVRVPNTHKCSVCGESPTVSHGLCGKHRARFARHGHTDQTRPETWGIIEKHPLYHTWGWMKRKAGKKSAQPVCEEWLGDFRVFAAEVSERPSSTHKLRLLDPDKPYSKNNVFWAEQKIKVPKTSDTKKYYADYARQYRKDNPDNTKNNDLKKMYGITLSEYEDMWLRQEGQCKICGLPETSVIRGKKISLAVDHCHATGKIRGLLCHRCNKSLGSFKDDVSLLERAILYLKGDICD